MEELMELLGLHLPDGVPIALIPTVFKVGKDLADGNVHLSQESRAELQEAIEAYKRGEL